VPASVDQHAADALGLLDSLGMRSAHVLGYSYGGVVALEAALMAPTRIRSLTLLEPILLEVPSAGDFVAGMAPVMSRYTDGDMEGAVTATLAASAARSGRTSSL
jgi:pimeloyl-ACP methyl ester carboxylesterase